MLKKRIQAFVGALYAILEVLVLLGSLVNNRADCVDLGLKGARGYPSGADHSPYHGYDWHKNLHTGKKVFHAHNPDYPFYVVQC